MKHINNTGSFISWVLYAAILGIGLLCFIAGFCETQGMSTYLAIPFFLGAVIACGGTAYLLYLLGTSFRRLFDNPTALSLARMIGVTILLTIGLYLRLQCIVNLGFENSFYDNVVQIFNAQSENSIHGITYLYLRLYLLVFPWFGAYAGTTIFIETLFQLMVAFLMFFFLKSRVGYIAGLTAFGFMMCSPSVVGRIGGNSPEMLFLVLGMLLCYLLFPVTQKTRGSLYYLLCGILIGTFTYLDVMGVLVVALMVFGVVKKAKTVSLSTISGFFGFIIGFFTYLSVDAFQSDMKLGLLMRQWIGQYYLGDFLQIHDTMELFILMFIFGVGVFGIYFIAQRDLHSMVFILTAVLFAKEYVLVSPQVSGDCVLYLILISLAGISLQSCFELQTDADSVEEEIPDEKLVFVPLPEDSQQVEQNGWVYGIGEGKRNNYIENPLPAPKRHVRRTFDYPVQVSERNNHYDYSVSEEDDYDI